MALLQMLLLQFLTSEAVQAWVIRQGMIQIQIGAERTLEEYGVTDSLQDVFGTRMERIQAKILKLLQMCHPRKNGQFAPRTTTATIASGRETRTSRLGGQAPRCGQGWKKDVGEILRTTVGSIEGNGCCAVNGVFFSFDSTVPG
jgi:hypothetical protein